MQKFKSFFLEFLKTLISSLLLVFLFSTFIAKPIRVEGTSMQPNLHDGDFGFGGVITKLRGFSRFDTVIIRNNKTQNYIVKRIIGLPFETVEYHDNRLFINGNYTEEAFLNPHAATNDFKVKLGQDEYYCLGDNRQISKDSRYYGAFKAADIAARGILVVYPLSDLGFK